VTILTDHQDGDQLRQKSEEEAGQTENVIIFEHGEGILPRSILDLQHQSHGDDRLIDVRLILQVGVVEEIETMVLMGETMIVDEMGMVMKGMGVAMKEGMIEDLREVNRMKLMKLRRQSANENWQKCNKRLRNWILTEKSVWQHWQSKRKRIARLRTEHVRSPRNILTKELSSAAYARRLTIRGWLIVLGAVGKAFRELKIDMSVALVWEFEGGR